MLATACRRGHLDVVRLLVHAYNADARDCGIHSDEFAVITGLPLYAAAQAGKTYCHLEASWRPSGAPLQAL
jgi:hypothetical protein